MVVRYDWAAMANAVFTLAAGPFDAEEVKAAFLATPTLTAIDAARAARSGRSKGAATPGGIVAVGLDESVANALALELTARGIDAKAVDEAWLRLPVPQPCMRAEVTDTELVFHLYDGTLAVAWSDVACISCGVVTATRGRALSDAMPIRRACGGATRQILTPEPLPMDRSFLEQDRLILEVVLEEPLRRFRFQSDQFHIGSARAREGAVSPYRERRGPQKNVALLLSELVDRAERAGVSLGTRALLAEGRPHRYRSMTEFVHEVAWLLWRHRGPMVAARAHPFFVEDVERDEQSALADRALEARTVEHDRYMESTRHKDVVIGAVGGGLGSAVLAVSVLEQVSLIAVVGAAALALLTSGVTTDLLRKRRSDLFWGA